MLPWDELKQLCIQHYQHRRNRKVPTHFMVTHHLNGHSTSVNCLWDILRKKVYNKSSGVTLTVPRYNVTYTIKTIPGQFKLLSFRNGTAVYLPEVFVRWRQFHLFPVRGAVVSAPSQPAIVRLTIYLCFLVALSVCVCVGGRGGGTGIASYRSSVLIV